MMTHMKERLAGKIGNANNNAFMLRKLFKMYDTAGSGYVSPSPSCPACLHAADVFASNSCLGIARQLLMLALAGAMCIPWHDALPTFMLQTVLLSVPSRAWHHSC